MPVHVGAFKKNRQKKLEIHRGRHGREARTITRSLCLNKKNPPAISSVSVSVSLFKSCQNNKLKEALVYVYIYLDWEVSMSASEIAFRKSKL